MWISLICPRCHSRMTMECLKFDWAKSKWDFDYYNLLYSTYEFNQEVEYKQYLYKCWNKHCNSLIVTICRNNEENVKFMYPQSPESFDFSQFENIKNISPNFVSVFNDAHSVDVLWYKEIAWPWYRKAMEYLLKDYALYLVWDNEEKKEKIIKEWIMDCIKWYIKDSGFQELAKHTMWLWNDQVHYYQKREDKDIDYLKWMIETAMNYIEMHLRMSKYADDFKWDTE